MPSPRSRRSPRSSQSSSQGTPSKRRNEDTSSQGEAPSSQGTPRRGRRERPSSQGTPRHEIPSSGREIPSSGATPRREEGHFIVEPSDPFSLPISTPGQRSISSPLNYGTPSSMGSVRTSGTGRSTPHRRADIGTDRHIRQFNINSDQVDPASGEIIPGTQDSDGGPNLVIWGTDVVVSRCKTKFKSFIKNFVGTYIDDIANTEEIEPSHVYLNALDAIGMVEEQFMNVNCAHLQQFDSDLYRQLVSYPQEVIPTLDMAVNEAFYERHPHQPLAQQIQVRPFNAEKTKNMRSLNPEDIDRLITISGMVIRTSGIIPEMREAFFRCSVCHLTTAVEVDRGRVAEPTLCTNCSTAHAFQLIHNRCQFSDKQLVKLQESPDDIPAGQTPHTVVLYAHNDLVDHVHPGDRVTITGIYRAVPIQVNPRMRNVKSVYKTHVDVLHYQKFDSKRLAESEDSKPHNLSPERVEALKLLSERGDLYERLANAIAPSIFENEDIKKGILLQLFGGTKKNFVQSGRVGFRSDINILLCGDPGTSKSQLLSYIYDLVPKSQYTSGKGSSAVGLTAYVTKDPETRQLVLQTGALVLADNGICCIDEFDKMNESTRSVLHEVMEQQTLSIAKAGIICQLNARTSILAAANPVESQWNKNKTIIENIKLPHTLMSRFDLIFLMVDPQSELYDRKLARHLVSLYYNAKEREQEELIDMSYLRDYISYARTEIHPRLSDEASQQLIHSYVEMRRVGSGKGQISAYPRQLEALIRLSEAHAKMRLSSVVEVKDVQEANRLHREALKQSATDPLSGKIDISILTTGLSLEARKKRQELSGMLKKLFEGKAKGSSFSYQKVFKEMRDTAQMLVTREMFEEALKEMQDNGIISITKNTIKLVS